MNDSKMILTSTMHTAQMGQNGIKCVMDKAVCPELRRELRSQLKEYDNIETMAKHLARLRDWDIPKVNPLLLGMSSVTSRARLMVADKDSVIAGMLIQGNTRGRILGLKKLSKAEDPDPAIVALSQKLLDLEQENIESAQDFL